MNDELISTVDLIWLAVFTLPWLAFALVQWSGMRLEERENQK